MSKRARPKTVERDTSGGISITKLDAARRQLETAIHLYFQEGDLVSIHTLAAAAHQVLRAISRSREKGTQLLRDFVLSQILPEKQEAWRVTMAEAENFFKHGTRDPNSVLEGFSQGQSEFLLIDACFTYRRIAGERPAIVWLFEIWSRLTWAKSWLQYGDPQDAAQAMNSAVVRRLALSTRSAFFAEMMPVVQAWTAGRVPTLPA